MNLLSKYLKWIVGIVTIIGVILSAYSLFYKEKPKLEVQTISERLLTAPTDVKDLIVNYRFKDTINVHNLWQVQYVIRNIGDVTLIGEGANNIIIGNGLPCNYSKDGQILSSHITLNTVDAVLKDNKIMFKQWRKNEFIELTALIESVECPKLTISDRDIKDSEIIYTKYSPSTINENIKLIDYFPKGFANILKWIVVVAYLILFIATLTEIKKQLFSISIGEKIVIIIIWGVFIISILSPLLWIF